MLKKLFGGDVDSTLKTFGPGADALGLGISSELLDFLDKTFTLKLFSGFFRKPDDYMSITEKGGKFKVFLFEYAPSMNRLTLIPSTVTSDGKGSFEAAIILAAELLWAHLGERGVEAKILDVLLDAECGVRIFPVMSAISDGASSPRKNLNATRLALAQEVNLRLRNTKQ